MGSWIIVQSRMVFRSLSRLLAVAGVQSSPVLDSRSIWRRHVVEKIALVTGAAGGLGQSVAASLAEAGWTLIVTSRDSERLRRSYGDSHLQVVADCSSVAGSQPHSGGGQSAPDAADGIGALRRQYPPGCVAPADGRRLHGLPQRQPDQRLPYAGGFHRCRARREVCRERQCWSRRRPQASAPPITRRWRQQKPASKGWCAAPRQPMRANGIRINAVAPGIMDTPASTAILGSYDGPRRGGSAVPLARHWLRRTNWRN
jgi:hypothetical protein